MATDGIKQLRAAVLARLTADSTLSALVNGIYDFVGATQAYPYVSVDALEAREWSHLSSRGMEVSFTIEAATRDKDSARCGDILARLHTLLHRANFTVTGYALQFVHWQESSLNETAAGYQGRARFLARLTEN